MLVLAIDAISPTESQIQCLGSRVMAWGAQSWLVDLDPFVGYWQHIATTHHTTVSALWKTRIAEAIVGITPSQLDTPLAVEQVPVYAVWDYSPLRALIMMEEMKRTQRFGWIWPNSVRHTELWRSVSWETWTIVVNELIEHWGHSPLKLDIPKTKAAAKRLHITAQRLRLTPGQLHRLPIDGIQRRYGPWIARLCGWLNDRHAQDTHYFPWKLWRTDPPLSISRSLDTPTCVWDYCTQEIIDDLDTLSRQCANAIVQMDWHIQLEHGDAFCLPLRFRLPHILSTEQGRHNTVRLHLAAEYRRWMERTISSPKPRVWIKAWTIEISGRVTATISRPTLFEWTADAEQNHRLETITNQVTTPLHRYNWAPHWTPELGYIDSVTTDKVMPLLNTTVPPSALSRPLFTTTTPQPFRTAYNQRIFTEAVMAPWWQSTSIPPERYYSVAQDSNRRWVWISQSPLGTEIHGIYA